MTQAVYLQSVFQVSVIALVITVTVSSVNIFWKSLQYPYLNCGVCRTSVTKRSSRWLLKLKSMTQKKCTGVTKKRFGGHTALIVSTSLLSLKNDGECF